MTTGNWMFKKSGDEFAVGLYDTIHEWYVESVWPTREQAIQRIATFNKRAEESVPEIHIWMEGGVIHYIQASLHVDIVLWDEEEADQKWGVDSKTLETMWSRVTKDCIDIPISDPIERHADLIPGNIPIGSPPIVGVHTVLRALQTISRYQMTEKQRIAVHTVATLVERFSEQ